MKTIILLISLMSISPAVLANAFINGEIPYYAQNYIYNLNVDDSSKNALKQYSTAIVEFLNARLTKEEEINNAITQINLSAACMKEHSNITSAHIAMLSSILFAKQEDRNKMKLFEETFPLKIQLDKKEIESSQLDHCN